MNWSSLPPLTALRALAAYAETGSMAEAGARLNVSHAAISQQIRQLEERLGVTLLDRKGGPGALTAEGRTLARTTLDGFADIVRLVEELTGRDADRPVQISTTPAFASGWMMPRLARFRQKHPGISLMIDPSPELRDLAPGGLDMAVRYGSGVWPGLEAELIVETPIVIVAAPELVGDTVYDSPAELTKFHWLQELGTNEASDYLAHFGTVLDQARGLTSLPGNLMADAARAGQGIAVTAGAFVEQDLASGRLRLLFEDRRKKGYFLVTRPGVQRSGARALYRWLRSEGRAYAEQRETSGGLGLAETAEGADGTA
ncbi:Transcriptional Regulator, LysR family protein [Pseudooceanicola batsensis HTCC2597]|uniref:Transcriptional Regulator, LysR family protein n=1 Tax=Pseudooceanicola batsensis (strain ATCC BAA-863 / DSM 15984 / KCTC 12145 / HTCC2597) TaxID=252305 RepID=A3TVK0_PSEBH|nr:LysR family transcriptional regulator [Pseudooceanicola batsensis]EAQ03646.1 Transcriptional Regulator, LysR family protein [Pseudooceanicola batsensis HTCC2597]